MTTPSTSSNTASNWGRFGATDERGMANLLQGDVVVDACRLPASGRVYELGLEIKRGAPVGGPRAEAIHLMAIDGGDFAALGQDDWGTADDYLVMATGGTTHVDGLCHMWYDGHLYNGFPFTEVRSSGAAKCGIEKMGPLVTRAHLLDFSAHDSAHITAADVDAWMHSHGVDVRAGDALLFRTGWIDAALRHDEDGRVFPAVAADVAEFVAAHDIAIVGADNIAVEHTPGPKQRRMPLHEALIRDLGVAMLELLCLTEPATDGVRTGLFVAAPLRIHRGANSPLNPLLIV